MNLHKTTQENLTEQTLFFSPTTDRERFNKNGFLIFFEHDYRDLKRTSSFCLHSELQTIQKSFDDATRNHRKTTSDQDVSCKSANFLIETESEILEKASNKLISINQSKHSFSNTNHQPSEEIAAEVLKNPLVEFLIRFHFSKIPVRFRFAVWNIRLSQIRTHETWKGKEKTTIEKTPQEASSYVSMILINRANLCGGQSRICDSRQKPIETTTLQFPFDSLLMNGQRVLHQITPIQTIRANLPAYRDLLQIEFDPVLNSAKN